MSLDSYDSVLNPKTNDKINMPFSLAEIQSLDVKALLNDQPKVRYEAIQEFLKGDYQDKITILRKLYKVEKEFKLKSFIQTCLNDQQKM
ncbi:MAG: hypothetical protein KC646_13540 [Candidatus Cloacimonetes bacterium]|nr:hypothetical protein [Candidatus Cloacimonadota bacterium]